MDRGGGGRWGGIKEIRASRGAFLCLQSIKAAERREEEAFLKQADMLHPKTLSFISIDAYISPAATGRSNTSAYHLQWVRQVRASVHVCMHVCASVCESEVYCQPSREPSRGYRPGYVTSLCQLRLWQSLSQTPT